MASSVLLYVVCSLFSWATSAKTRVEITSPAHPLTVGGILVIQCQVWQMQDGYMVDIFRVLDNGRTDQITVRGDYYSRSSLGERGFLAKRSFNDGSTVLFLTVVDILWSDQGSYLCTVESDLQGKFVEITRDTVDIEIYTFPRQPYPSCNNIPNTRIVQENRKLTLTCTTEKGYPVVDLIWSCSKDDIHFDIHNSESEDSITSELTLTVDATHSGAVFVCKMTSTGFPDRVRSCTVVPLTVLKSAGHVTASIRPSVKMVGSNKNEGPFTDTKCNTSCPPDDPYTILYWAVACVGTSILMFVFLATTIIYCCKYNSMSTEVISAHGSFTSCDGTEPVYVSLQRRQPPERNSMFMSVEDPNNPGNKVLMPREVFDEFYRSLSLKKRENSH